MRKVRLVSFVAGFIAMAIGAGHAQVKAPATQRQPEKLVLAVVLIADTNPLEYVLTINNAVGFKTMASLKKYVGDLPAGSTITWAPSDVTVGDEPLRSDKELKDFAAFCEAKKVKLVVIPGG